MSDAREAVDIQEALHAVLTVHGIASRSDYQPLVTDLVVWAAAMCRQSQSADLAALREQLKEQVRAAFHEGWIALEHMGGTLSEEECWQDAIVNQWKGVMPFDSLHMRPDGRDLQRLPDPRPSADAGVTHPATNTSDEVALREQLAAVTQDRDACQQAVAEFKDSEVERLEDECEVLREHLAAVTRERDGLRRDIDRLTRGTYSLELGRLSGANLELREQLQAVTQERDDEKTENAHLQETLKFYRRRQRL